MHQVSVHRALHHGRDARATWAHVPCTHGNSLDAARSSKAAALAVGPGLCPVSCPPRRTAGEGTGRKPGATYRPHRLRRARHRAAVQALRADPNTHLVAMGTSSRIAWSLLWRDHQGDGRGGTGRIKVTESSKFLGFDAYEKVLASGVDVVAPDHAPLRPPHAPRAAIKADKHVFAEEAPRGRCHGPCARCSPRPRRPSRRTWRLQVGFCWRYAQAERGDLRPHQRGRESARSPPSTLPTTPARSAGTRANRSGPTLSSRSGTGGTSRGSGDHLVEQAVHSIDRLSGPWATSSHPVHGPGRPGPRTGPESGNAYDHFTVAYEFEAQARHPDCRQIDACSNDNSDYVYGTKGQAHVNGFNEHAHSQGSGRQGDLEVQRPVHRHVPERARPALASIRAGKPINDGERGAQSTLMALMGRMAAYTGQTVTWEQALNSKEELVPTSWSWARSRHLRSPCRGGPSSSDP